MMRQQFYKKQDIEKSSAAINSSAHSSNESHDASSKGSIQGYETADVQSIEGGSSMSLKGQGSQHKKIVSKIGACGRKIADAMKSVKNTKGQRDRADSRASTGQVKTSNLQ